MRLRIVEVLLPVPLSKHSKMPLDAGLAVVVRSDEHKEVNHLHDSNKELFDLRVFTGGCEAPPDEDYATNDEDCLAHEKLDFPIGS